MFSEEICPYQKEKQNILKSKQQGTEGIILSCTEILLLPNQSGYIIPLFDTTKIHSAVGVDHVLSLE